MSLSLLSRPRAGLARAVRHRIAGAEFETAHAQIWHTSGPRWFTEDDAIWRVHGDTAMFVGGIRALLLQSLHPVAMLGVSEHSGFRGDPWGRLQRTSTYLATTTYGRVADAERSIAIVRAIHGRVRGVTPSGEPYRADEPHLLAWVHVAQVDSFLRTHQVFGARPLDPAGCDAYVRQAGEIAARLGVPDPPTTVAEVDALLDRYRPELGTSPAAQGAAQLLLAEPPLPGPARIGYAALAAGALATLPDWARHELGRLAHPAVDRFIALPLGRRATATLRWALAAPSARVVSVSGRPDDLSADR